MYDEGWSVQYMAGNVRYETWIRTETVKAVLKATKGFTICEGKATLLDWNKKFDGDALSRSGHRWAGRERCSYISVLFFTLLTHQ
jgi:hypothetical protein